MYAVLFLGSLALFSRTLHFGFVDYGDPACVTANLHVQGGLSWAGLKWAMFGQAGPWQPLAWISHMTDWQIYGKHAAGHHFTSLLLHALNGLLLFAVVRRLAAGFWTAAACAAVFAWHPLRVESVAWVAERKDLLGGTWFLLTLWCYLNYARRAAGGKEGAWRPYVLALEAYAAGLMSAPMLVTVPGVLLLLDYWPLRRGGGAAAWGRLALEKLPFLALAAGTALVTLRMQAVENAFVLRLPLSDRLGNAVVSAARYLGKFIWPFDLSVCYPHPGRWPLVWVVLATVLVAGLTVLAAVQRKKRPWVIVGWLWFLGMLVPVIGLVQAGYQSMADRYTYLPMIGVELAVLLTVREWVATRRGRLAAGVAGVLVLAGCGARTWVQEGVWRDSKSLFEHALAVTHRNAVAHYFLGITLLDAGRASEAAVQCERAVAIAPGSPAAHAALGLVRAIQGRLADSEAEYDEALRLSPDDATILGAAGAVQLRRGEFRGAAERFALVLRQRPDSLRSVLGLAEAQAALGRTGDAEKGFKRALAMAPNEPTVQTSYAEFLASHGRLADALIHFEAAAKQDPTNPTAHRNLGDSLRGLGHLTQAIAEYRRALRLRPNDALTEFGMGLALQQADRAPEALAAYIRAARISPDFSEAHLRIALMMLDREKLDEAVVHIDRALETTTSPASIHRIWADALARHGYYNDAIDHYEQELRLNPHDAESHAVVGALLWITGKHAQAISHWETALKLDPTIPGLAERLKEAKEALEASGSASP